MRCRCHQTTPSVMGLDIHIHALLVVVSETCEYTQVQCGSYLLPINRKLNSHTLSSTIVSRNVGDPPHLACPFAKRQLCCVSAKITTKTTVAITLRTNINSPNSSLPLSLAFPLKSYHYLNKCGTNLPALFLLSNWPFSAFAPAWSLPWGPFWFPSTIKSNRWPSL